VETEPAACETGARATVPPPAALAPPPLEELLVEIEQILLPDVIAKFTAVFGAEPQRVLIPAM
jgi:hypothetical protein